MSTLQQIREGMASTLKANLSGVQVYSRVEDVVETPAIVVDVDPKHSADFTGAFARGMDEWYLHLHVFVSRYSGEGGYAQKMLDPFLTGSGVSSIRQVLFQNPTLGLSDTDATATGVMNYGGENQYAGVPHVGATIKVCVRTSGT